MFVISIMSEEAETCTKLILKEMIKILLFVW
jgi:hypothetical protein